MERTIKTLKKVLQREELTTRKVDRYLHNKGFLIYKVTTSKLIYKTSNTSDYLCVTFKYEFGIPMV